jgi:general secretion pathway protein C
MTPGRRDEIALRVVSVLVVGSIAWALAALTWRLVGWDDGRSEVAVAESLPPPGGAVGGPDADVARIVSLAPFGGGAAAVGGLPTSSLGLVLKGVLSAYPASASTALIAVGEGPAAIFGVGQSPIGNAVIEAIEVDHVILNVDGTRERLDFPAPVAPLDPATTTPGAGITIAPAPTAGPAPPSPAPGAAAALAAASPVASAAAASAGRPAPPPLDAGATPNVAAAAGAAGVSATAAGYRIGANPSPELRRFGLQPGDVIESLNGQPVGQGSTDQQLFERARSAGQARVVIVRSGRRITLNVPLR